MIGIIDNKKIDISPEEWELYNKIVKSYTNPPNRGEDLFIDLFETNENGIIISIKPPSNQRTSLEVFLFVITLFQQQHMRLIHAQVDDICNQFKEKIKQI